MSNSSDKVQTLGLKQFTAFEEATFKFSPGINVLLGENGTGKTQVLKVIYALLKMCESSQPRQSLAKEERGNWDADKFFSIFPQNDHLLHQRATFSRPNRADLDLEYANVRMSWSLETSLAMKLTNQPSLPRSPALIYLPAQEFLSINPGFLATYQKRELPYDATYYDLALALNALPLRTLHLVDVQETLESLKTMLAGKEWAKEEILIQQDQGRFYFDLPEGQLDVRLVADGYRKLGTLWYLLRNGSLTKDSILFWDEPEANLNPKWMVKVANVLQQLARLGMQIFIATHDFLLSYELSLLNEYPSANPVELRFFSLHKPDGKFGVIVESGKTLNEIQHNPIVEAFATHYDREADLFYATATDS